MLIWVVGTYPTILHNAIVCTQEKEEKLGSACHSDICVLNQHCTHIRKYCFNKYVYAISSALCFSQCRRQWPGWLLRIGMLILLCHCSDDGYCPFYCSFYSEPNLRLIFTVMTFKTLYNIGPRYLKNIRYITLHVPYNYQIGPSQDTTAI